MAFKIPTPAQLLQIGHDCGFELVEDAYGSMMQHYDAFFLVASLRDQLKQFHKSLEDTGLGRIVGDVGIDFGDLTIVDAAKKINYTFKPLEIPEPQGEPEELDFN